MLASSFRTNRPFILLLLPPLAIALWGRGFIVPPITEHIAGMPGFMFLSDMLAASSIWQSIIGLLVLLTVALLSNAIYNELELFERKDQFAALLFVIFTSITGYHNILEPSLCAIPFILLAMRTVFMAQDKRVVMKDMLDAGLLLGVGSMFYSKAALFILPVMLANEINRPFNWREHAALIIGSGTPFLLMFLLREAFAFDYEFNAWAVDKAPWNGDVMLSLGALLLAFFMALPSAMGAYSHAIMRVKNSKAGIAGFMLLFFILGLLEIFLERPGSASLIAIPAAYYGSYFYRGGYNTVLSESAFTIFLVIAIWVQWS